jgi:hypothetical protein
MEVVPLQSHGCGHLFREMSAVQPEVQHNSICRDDRDKIPKALLELSKMPDSNEVVPTQSRDCRRYFREMAAAKPEVSLTRVVEVLETKFESVSRVFEQ